MLVDIMAAYGTTIDGSLDNAEKLVYHYTVLLSLLVKRIHPALLLDTYTNKFTTQ